MNIVFMGTPNIAKECLKKIVENGEHSVKAVFTQPDKQSGRGKKITFSAVKEYALQQNIKVYQPLKIKDSEWTTVLKEINPDLIVVVAYGQILPKSIIDIPKFSCINVHGSLLPKYRGASPIQTARINGDKKTGISIMYINEGLDTGDVILKSEIDIDDTDTSSDLFLKMSELGANTLINAIALIQNGEVVRVVQNESEATYTKMLKKEMGQLNFKDDALKIHNLIMGLNAWPLAYTTFKGKKLKIFRSKVVYLDNKNFDVGVIVDNKSFIVSCGNNTFIEFLEVLVEGGKKMSGKSFIVGRNIEKNKILLGV